MSFQTFKTLSLNKKRFLGLGLKKFISQNIRNFLRVGSFYLSSSESYLLKYKRNITLDSFFTKRSIVDVCQCSEYASSSKYARVLNMPSPKYKKVPFPEI